MHLELALILACLRTSLPWTETSENCEPKITPSSLKLFFHIICHSEEKPDRHRKFVLGVGLLLTMCLWRNLEKFGDEG
jgi:hypothetical protein